MKKTKNIFWVVFDNKRNAVSISNYKHKAKELALFKGKYRWTFQTFNKDWNYMVKDGYIIHKIDFSKFI